MSAVELQPEVSGQLMAPSDVKPLMNNQPGQAEQAQNQEPKSQQHPLHQYDLTIMQKFYDLCLTKFSEQNANWKPSEWMHMNPMPTQLSWEQKNEWPNPTCLSQKQRVYEAFARLARESGEPMILLPNFEYGDLMNFDRFLQSMRQDGVNSIGKYKHFLNSKDMRKTECDLVVIHPRFGVLLFEVKDCDHFDVKRRSSAKSHLNQARSCFDSIARFIGEVKGFQLSECRMPITEFVALPSVTESPLVNNQALSPKGDHNTSASSTSSSRPLRQLNFLIKTDLEDSAQFAKWWTRCVAEPKSQQFQQAEAANKVNKFDVNLMNLMVGFINNVRNNSILPVVYAQTGDFALQQEAKEHFQPALNIHAEFFKPTHEKCRSWSKVVLLSKDTEKTRRTICLQTLWLLLNDSQKKISVVCSEVNKPYYEEFFARQRKVYNSLNNLRIYTNFHSCDSNGQHTIKNNGEVWIFDSGINGSLRDVFERVKEMKSYWIFTEQEDLAAQLNAEMTNLDVKLVKLDDQAKQEELMPSIKFPMRVKCDLLVVSDLISYQQTNLFNKFVKSNAVLNQAMSYQNHGQHDRYHQQQQQQMHQLKFNPSKKFRSVKFIRGGSIDNLRTQLKMHDSVVAPVVLVHVGDEDLFKTRDSTKTHEHIKELTTLIREYCPNSFVMLSTLMRRRSRTENGIINDVNKGIINFCKQTKTELNCFYMLNNHFEPNFHTQEGRQLTNKGLRLYMDNILFTVDYFLVRNNKQH
ncbi:hypothetical protein BpHYR1_011006 [Brachionus plicatilis]|uniref:NERD domain-containing protein n=1 Tax=Brachionus plicatilis TaxID=10195 RepID=A0A3M7PRD3_BRAPC|nr:hypothetical protein BpHYR1_011006 [Brachionus plicatilis]